MVTIKPGSQIFTIGHSIHPIDEFIALLQAHGIETVIDIRSIPKSRHCPQFNQGTLMRSLRKSKIGYRHMKGLGGLRHPMKNSVNTGWINPSFRGFADYMLEPQFQKALELLEKVAKKRKCALMCAEAVPWRCHRSLIADVLSLRKWKVFHIQSLKTVKRHKRTPFLRIKKGRTVYI